MSVKPENTFIQSIHKHLPLGVYRMKNNSHVRLDSDTVELNHEYNGQISVSISVVEVPE